MATLAALGSLFPMPTRLTALGIQLRHVAQLISAPENPGSSLRMISVRYW